MKILNQEIFALTVTYDAFSKNSFALFFENLKISIAMDMSSLKHFMNMNDFAIEIFDFGIAMNAFSKNSSIQHIENSETLEKDSIYTYELFALFAFDFSIDIDFEIYTMDIEAVIQRPVASLRSFHGLALRHNSFGWSRCSTNSIGSRTSISICTSTSAVTSTTSDVTLDSIEIVKIVNIVDTDFYGGEQSFCFSVDHDIVDAIVVVVADIDALILTAGLVNATKNSVWMSLLGPVVDVAPKPKHKELPKMKIKQ